MNKCISIMLITIWIRWYQMNYSNAEQLVWGRGDGCGYAAGSCGGYIKSQQQK